MTFERHKINERVIQDLKKRSTIGLLIYITLSFIVFYSGDFHVRHSALAWTFLLSNIVICLFRMLHSLLSSKIGKRFETIDRVVFYVSVVITALIWGVMFALVMFMKQEHAAQLIMILCVCGLGAGGVVAYIPDRRLSLTFNATIILPAILTMFVNRSDTALLVMFCAFSIYMMMITFKGNGEYWNALENEHLLEIKSLELAHLSNTDALTGLYNRRYFNDSLEREWKRSGRDKSPIALLIMDIDYFKRINDTHGHQAGDEYLKKLAETLSSVFKRDTDIVARYGGEEFTILLQGMDLGHAMRLAENAIQAVAAMKIDYQGEKIGTTISVGINSCVPDSKTRPDSFITGADQALYRAKGSGRNRVVVFGELTKQK